MPRPRKLEIDAVLPMPDGDNAARLLAEVGKLIVIRNANGARSRKFCLLCGEARRIKQRCVHDTIWAMMESE